MQLADRPVGHFQEAAAFGDQVEDAGVAKVGHLLHRIPARRADNPEGGGEAAVHEHRAVEADGAQHLGQHVRARRIGNV
ncbi:MAG TPA: hypothetical protein VEA44_16915 [Caulobacter sp.]|nr:hypothetical protein [Caulobacter sp.]